MRVTHATSSSRRYEIGNNATLLALDVSAHGSGDAGATALAKVACTMCESRHHVPYSLPPHTQALLSNNTLQTLTFDENATTRDGFEALRVALARNFSLREMPPPFSDCA
jgi:hypothetical protein